MLDYWSVVEPPFEICNHHVGQNPCFLGKNSAWDKFVGVRPSGGGWGWSFTDVWQRGERFITTERLCRPVNICIYTYIQYIYIHMYM